MAVARTSRVSTVGASVRRLQAEVEDLVSRVQKGLTELDERRREAVNGFLRQLRRIRDDVQARAETAGKGPLERAGGVLSSAEERAVQIAEPVAMRLNIASRDEVEALRERVAYLEKRVDEMVSKSAQAA